MQDHLEGATAMGDLDAGDLVRATGSDFDMLVIGRADDPVRDLNTPPSVFCVWERAHYLNEEVFLISELELVRKERRRAIRNGRLDFPSS
jgi:hypothetical protein